RRGEFAGKAFAAFETCRFAARRGGIVVEFPGLSPISRGSGFDFEPGLFVAGVEPTAIVKRLAVGKYNAVDNHRLFQFDTKPVIGSVFVIKGDRDGFEVVVNDRTGVRFSGADFHAISQQASIARSRLAGQPDFIFGTGRTGVRKWNERNPQRGSLSKRT